MLVIVRGTPSTRNVHPNSAAAGKTSHRIEVLVVRGQCAGLAHGTDEDGSLRGLVVRLGFRAAGRGIGRPCCGAAPDGQGGREEQEGHGDDRSWS